MIDATNQGGHDEALRPPEGAPAAAHRQAGASKGSRRPQGLVALPEAVQELLRAFLRAEAAERPTDGIRRAAKFLGASPVTTLTAAVGLPVRESTAAMIQGRLVGAKTIGPADLEAVLSKADPRQMTIEDRIKASFARPTCGQDGCARGWMHPGGCEGADGKPLRIAVCPRCLDIEPGKPAGDPNVPHPGPFRDALCPPCVAANLLETSR